MSGFSVGYTRRFVFPIRAGRGRSDLPSAILLFELRFVNHDAILGGSFVLGVRGWVMLFDTLRQLLFSHMTDVAARSNFTALLHWRD